MDYIGNKCPVCDKYFHVGDDVVVCPDCGTPSHRECYEKLGKCANHDKHSEGFEYNDQAIPNDAEYTACSKCGAKNPKDAFFCNKCGNNLNLSDKDNRGQNVNTNGQQYGGMPFGNGSPYQNVVFLDPLAGVKPESDIGDNIKAGEMAKFVKQNTPYFIKVFSDIKNFSKSRFNFCAAIFLGGYILYRKMYKLGAFITTVQAAIMILSMYIQVYLSNSSGFLNLMKAYESRNYDAMMQAMSKMTTLESSFMFLTVALTVIMFVLRIVCGVCFNRLYYNHCKKQINNIKSSDQLSESTDNALQTKGGVNVAIAMSLAISYFVIQYLPYFFI